MKNSTDKPTKEIMQAFADKYKGTFLHATACASVFARMEAEKKSQFSKYSVVIPWYLKPFSNTITRIAYASFKDGLSENCTDTVTVKRPTPYRAK